MSPRSVSQLQVLIGAIADQRPGEGFAGTRVPANVSQGLPRSTVEEPDARKHVDAPALSPVHAPVLSLVHAPRFGRVASNAPGTRRNPQRQAPTRLVHDVSDAESSIANGRIRSWIHGVFFGCIEQERGPRYGRAAPTRQAFGRGRRTRDEIPMRRRATTAQTPCGHRPRRDRDIRLRAAQRAEREHRRLHTGADTQASRTCDASPPVPAKSRSIPQSSRSTPSMARTT